MKSSKTRNNSKIIMFLVFTILVTGILSYKLINNAVVYEIMENSENTVLGNTNLKLSSINTKIENIPETENGYVLYFQNDTFYVYTTDGKALYADTGIDASAFTANDLEKLSQNGIFISELTELTETINYLKS